MKYCLLVLALALVAGSQAQAQKKGGFVARKGFFFGFGVGYGSLGLSCSGCSTDRETGPSGTLQIGTAVGSHMTLGLETNGFYKSLDNDETIKGGHIGASLHYYPSATGNLFLRGGVGYNIVRDEIPGDEFELAGPGAAIGVGYDFYLGRTISLTPYANYIMSFSSTVKENGVEINIDAKPNLWQVGVALMFH